MSALFLLRRCSVCGSFLHDKRHHVGRFRETKPRQRPLRRNIDAFYDASGLIHPIRNSPGYMERLARERRDERRMMGVSTADQQVGYAADRWEEKHGDTKLYRLEAERDALREALDNEPASRLTGLIRKAGAERGEVNKVPFEQARPILRRELGRTPESYDKAGIVTRDKQGRRYLRWEFILDEVAANLGYRSDTDLKRAIEQSAKDKQELADLDAEIRAFRAGRQPKKARRKSKAKVARRR